MDSVIKENVIKGGVINDGVIRDGVLAVARRGRTSAEALGYFRLALGLHYLAGLVTPETLDFKQIDRRYNRLIYQLIGGGHSITSVLQFMSGEKVVPVLECARFHAAFAQFCPGVPVATIPFLLSLNLGVAKNISRIDIGGPVLDWIERHTPAPASAPPASDA
ncbi:hypothetical protein [Massilia glaciei]|uniref:Uncharacterized protein n=1 Tax=Massilia glaciei TaxID=1524097 RepID=A0A2U2HP18_9BURK|nr:hypothetical protein [Massilia glaciei]PWF49250.1 hypothetical protein C7C56_007545 [Massilia glaciei]